MTDQTTTEPAVPTGSVPAVEAAHYHYFFSDLSAIEKLTDEPFPRYIDSGDGIYLTEEGGRRLIDAGHHLGACSVGHGRAEIGERIAEQVSTLEFSSLENGLTHRPAVTLAKRLNELLPLDDPMLYFVSTGSEANEAALKLARAYHANRGNPRKTKLISRAGAYHGSSYGALSVSGNPALREPYSPGVGDVARATQPSPERCGYCTMESGCNLGCAGDIEQAILRESPDRVAAVIAEPISVHQAIKIPHDDYWARLRETCDRYDVLLIVDEVVTGFGRTGEMFGIQHWDIEPDIVTLAKGITSGYVPLGAAAAARRVVDAFAGPPFVHVNTYAGHPVACAAAHAALDIMEREDILGHVRALAPFVKSEAEKLADRPGVVRVSAIGMMASVEFRVPDAHAGNVHAQKLRWACYERDVLVRAAADAQFGTVWFMPPLTITEDEIAAVMGVIGEAFDSVWAAG